MEIIGPEERRTTIVEQWQTRAGLQALVAKQEWSEHSRKASPQLFDRGFLFDYYTGYVRMPDTHTLKEEALREDIQAYGGITFYGEMSHLGVDGVWIGFDMGHGWDSENTQDKLVAIENCESIAEQITMLTMIDKNDKEIVKMVAWAFAVVVAFLVVIALLENLDRDRASAADRYENCVQEQYGMMPWKYHIEYGHYPECK